MSTYIAGHLALLIALVVAGCARHRPVAPTAGEAHGLYTEGFEASHFRACADTGVLGERVAFDRSATWPTPWPAGGKVTLSGYRYAVFYVRWVLRDLPPLPPATPGHIRVSNAPRRGECGWPTSEAAP